MPPIVPLGVVLFSYLRLKLYLRGHGFAVAVPRLRLAAAGRGVWAARWRRGCARWPAQRVALVAHSMGGLVSRAALAHRGHQHVERVVLLGTPNSGSFAAVQALRGTYAVVRKVARLARHASAEELADGRSSAAFPSLYDLLPRAPGAPAGSTCSMRAPGRAADPGRAPRCCRRRARRTRSWRPPIERFAVIAGVGQETVTAVTRRNDDFVYTLTRHGDGTVPPASAQLPGATHVYAAQRAQRADARPPGRGGGRRIFCATARPRACRAAGTAPAAPGTQVSDRQLRREPYAQGDWAALTPRERRCFCRI